MNQQFNWNEAVANVLVDVYMAGSVDDSQTEAVEQALTALSQALKQAVDAAEPERNDLEGLLAADKRGELSEAERNIMYSKLGYNQAIAEFKANLMKIIDGETE